MLNNLLLISFIVAIVISSIGYYKYVYFISIGYGFSISAIGIYLLINNNLNLYQIILCSLFIIYGFRLSGYLLIRELKSKNYNKHMTGEIKQNKDVSFGVKIAIHISCALLYVFQTSPVIYSINNMYSNKTSSIIGIFIMLFGLIFESVADIQKNKYKKIDPHRFCDKGLYKIVRCPNYLGEMIFWTGVFISGIGVLSISQLLIASIGYIGIIYIMFSGARRLEIRQNKNYKDMKDYQEYIKAVPILLPFIHLYSVEKYKWLVG